MTRTMKSTGRQKKSSQNVKKSIRLLSNLPDEVSSARTPQKLLAFYRKRVPLAGGLSNVNLNRAWVRDLAWAEPGVALVCRTYLEALTSAEQRERGLPPA